MSNEQQTSKEQVSITVEGLRSLAIAAHNNNKYPEFMTVVLQWAEQASAEIARLRAAVEPSTRHPMLDVLAICDAYESGMGQGLGKREFVNPYDPVNDPHAYRAYGHGYDEGCKRRTAVPPVDALALAKRFHEVYERLASSFGYETRVDTRAFDPESKNGKLMVAVCAEIAGATVRANPQPCWCPYCGEPHGVHRSAENPHTAVTKSEAAHHPDCGCGACLHACYNSECADCPPADYPTDKTRCAECPHREEKA